MHLRSVLHGDRTSPGAVVLFLPEQTPCKGTRYRGKSIHNFVIALSDSGGAKFVPFDNPLMKEIEESAKIKGAFCGQKK